ncbi:hypothetical protein BDS110ZK25_21660 [Bradyrhizobium diazoefficiens]
MCAVALRRGDVPGRERHVLHSLAASGPPAGNAGDRLALRSIAMMDILMLALGFVFFALAIGYTYACERL